MQPVTIQRVLAALARCTALGVLAACVVAGSSVGLLGCAKPLLSPRESRTQFDNYRRSRNEYAPQFVTDEWGVRSPNLRGRLVMD